MGTCTRESGIRTRLRALECTLITVEQCTRVTGCITCSTVRAAKNGQMGADIRAITTKAPSQAGELTCGLTGLTTVVNGLIT